MIQPEHDGSLSLASAFELSPSNYNSALPLPIAMFELGRAGWALLLPYAHLPPGPRAAGARYVVHPATLQGARVMILPTASMFQ